LEKLKDTESHARSRIALLWLGLVLSALHCLPASLAHAADESSDQPKDERYDPEPGADQVIVDQPGEAHATVSLTAVRRLAALSRPATN
jgi:hypothetical protein